MSNGSLLDLARELGDYDGCPVLRVGVLEDATNIDTGEPVAAYAAHNEFGVPGRIPARKFMRDTIDAKENEWAEYLGRIIGRGVPLPTALELTGKRMVSDVQATIASNMAPDNAESTRRRKQRRVRGGAAGETMRAGTLIDTRSLVTSIKFEVTP